MSIKWGEIDSIKRSPTRGCTYIVSAGSKKKIRIEHQLDGYLELQSEIDKRLPHHDDTIPQLNAFHIASPPMWVVVAVSAGMIALGVVISNIGLKGTGGGLFIAIGVLVLIVSLFVLRSVTIAGDFIRFSTLLQTKTLHIREIVSVEQSQLQSGANATAKAGLQRTNAVVIKFRSGKRRVISGVIEGEEVLYSRLQQLMESCGSNARGVADLPPVRHSSPAP